MNYGHITYTHISQAAYERLTDTARQHLDEMPAELRAEFVAESINYEVAHARIVRQRMSAWSRIRAMMEVGMIRIGL